MGHHLPTHTEPPGDSHPNAGDETGLTNHPKSKFSEVAGEVSLGPGFGCIASSTIDHLTSFHGYLATGVFIGLQMLALGKRLLGIDGHERIHVECETYNCLPDAFQYLAGCTIGNKGLIVRDTGKIAVTITRHTPPGENAPGVRIVLDAEKTERFPKLHRWHMKTEKVPHDEVIQILMEAGDSVYSYEHVEVPVTARKKKLIAICAICGESFIQKEQGDRCCVDCAK